MSDAAMSTAPPTSRWEYMSVVVQEHDAGLHMLNQLAHKGWRPTAATHVAGQENTSFRYVWILLERPLPNAL